MIRVYVSAASQDVERARLWIARLRAAGIEVTATWPEVIAATGGISNPRNAMCSQRAEWSAVDVAEVSRADVLWLLAPPRGVDAPGRGAYFELGLAHALRKRLVSSGDILQSIFTALGDEYDTDAGAFEAITGRAP